MRKKQPSNKCVPVRTRVLHDTHLPTTNNKRVAGRGRYLIAPAPKPPLLLPEPNTAYDVPHICLSPQVVHLMTAGRLRARQANEMRYLLWLPPCLGLTTSRRKVTYFFRHIVWTVSSVQASIRIRIEDPIPLASKPAFLDVWGCRPLTLIVAYRISVLSHG